MFDLSLQQALFRLVAIVIVTGVAGLLLAAAFRIFGDDGPQHDGRLTPNPFAHLDLLAVVAGIIALTGWVRPIAVDPEKIRGRAIGLIAAVLLALIALIGVSWLLWSLRGNIQVLIPSASFGTGLAVFLRILVEMAVGFAVINLIPLPPLAMGIVLAGISPPAHAWLTKFDLVIRIALVVVLGLGALSGPLGQLTRPIRQTIGL